MTFSLDKESHVDMEFRTAFETAPGTDYLLYMWASYMHFVRDPTIQFWGVRNFTRIRSSFGTGDLGWVCLDAKLRPENSNLPDQGIAPVPTLVISVPFGPYVNECATRNYQRLGFQPVEGMLSSSAPDDAIRLASGGLPFLSVTEAFRRQSSNARLFFELDLHMTADAHALFAEQITPWVEEHVRAGLATLPPRGNL